MSVEASRWAIQADVGKSTSKLVLLNMAHLVRFDAEEWTVFASIDYLAKVTHLNRKTVLEALTRLKELGAIQDTGRRAGDNRSSKIYRLCPNGVPLIDQMATVAGAPASTVAVSQRDSLSATGYGREGNDQDEAQSPVATHVLNHAGRIDDIAPGDEMVDLAATKAAPSRAGLSGGHRTSAGAAPARLPVGWTLPARWRQWTLRERPHWTDEKVDAIAATFSAYMRSQPGEKGFSADWFETWRLWVFREWETTPKDRPWHDTWSGIQKRGKALGVVALPNEPPPAYKARVFQAAGVTLPR